MKIQFPGVIFEVPFPPSVNHYWRTPSTGALKGRTLISKKGRVFREKVAYTLRDMKAEVPGRLGIHIALFPPDKRKRDLDNYLKALLDSIVHAGMIKDDELIDELTIRRANNCSGGRAVVEIWSIVEET